MSKLLMNIHWQLGYVLFPKKITRGRLRRSQCQEASAYVGVRVVWDMEESASLHHCIGSCLLPVCGVVVIRCIIWPSAKASGNEISMCVLKLNEWSKNDDAYNFFCLSARVLSTT